MSDDTRTALVEELAAIIDHMRAKANVPDDRDAGSVWSWRVDEWADELSKLREAADRLAAPQPLHPDRAYRCVEDAPEHYSEPEANAWAKGYNHAVDVQADRPEEAAGDPDITVGVPASPPQEAPCVAIRRLAHWEVADDLQRLRTRLACISHANERAEAEIARLRAENCVLKQTIQPEEGEVAKAEGGPR